MKKAFIEPKFTQNGLTKRNGICPVKKQIPDTGKFGPIWLKTEPLHDTCNFVKNPNGKSLKCGFEKQDHDNPEDFHNTN